MGLISAGIAAVGGTMADQWLDFFTAPAFDEQTLVAPGVLHERNGGRGTNKRGSANIVTDGTRIAVPENTAVIITDGGGIVSVSTEPGYFVFRNDGQPSIFTGSGIRKSLITQSWERFKYGGTPGQQQLIYYVNLKEIRNQKFGTPGPLPYKDFSLVPEGASQAPVLRLRARGQYSIQVADPIRFFRNFLPANVRAYTLADEGANSQLTQEFITAFQAAVQSLSRSTDIASLAAHSPELASALTNERGAEGSWLERFGLEVVSVAISAIEYDQASRDLMDKYNKGVLLGGGVGNAYAQATVADAASAMAERGGGSDMVGLAMGLGAVGGTVSGLTQPTAPVSTPASDPVAVLGQLKAMLDQGLISQAQYAEKQQEVLSRM
ncbi:SPFH domain-containing protein [Nocardioides humilatus]|uniref:SPFH domain-containing protein n=1 Tax=Nocardioides humilatus TaxID=2607660 RepID=A0A5B1L4C7_9ACTN|nr:SPFH domain-containing protein [Nocardioides humilatus]KAA1415355.1 SPFH domain-containing protein [Nocardioides humilatus]